MQPGLTDTRQYWIWVTKPEYYTELEELEPPPPGSGSESQEDLGWWTCHKDTKAGDLVLLYRTSPRSDVAYLLEAGSDARVLEQDPGPGSIFEHEYKRLVDQALKESSDLRSRSKRAVALESEIAALDDWLDTALQDVEAPTDEKLRDELEQLWALREQLDEKEYAFLEEQGAAIGTEEQLAEVLKERFGQQHLDLDKTFDEYVSRASGLSSSFREYFEAANDSDRKLDELEKLEEEIKAQVLLQAGLDQDLFIDPDPDFAGSYVCDWVLRHKLERPLPLKELKADPFLSKEWNALRASFKGRVFRTRPDVWERLIALAGPENPGYLESLALLSANRVSPDIASELAIEDYLEHHLEALLPSYDFELYSSPSGRPGRQFSCREAGGFIDLLCRDKKSGDLVVVELKNKRATRDVAGQIKSYMGWVKERLATPSQRVRGLVIADGYDTKLKFALADIDNVEFLDLNHFWPPN